MDKKVEDIRMTLNILKMRSFKALIFLKEKGRKPFIAEIDEFKYENDDTYVILRRGAETLFPVQPGESQPETFLLNLKDIHAVDRFRG